MNIKNIYEKVKNYFFSNHYQHSYIYVDNDISFFENSIILIESIICAFPNVDISRKILYGNDIEKYDIPINHSRKDCVKLVFILKSKLHESEFTFSFIYNKRKKNVITRLNYIHKTNLLSVFSYTAYNNETATSNDDFLSICSMEYEVFNNFMDAIIEKCHSYVKNSTNSKIEKIKDDEKLNREVNLHNFNKMIEKGEL